jgi:hypothetical protein
MLDTVCAWIITDGMEGDTGVTSIAPTPAAVVPISTILSRYLSEGILPLYTSKNESTVNAGRPSRSWNQSDFQKSFLVILSRLACPVWLAGRRPELHSLSWRGRYSAFLNDCPNVVA